MESAKKAAQKSLDSSRVAKSHDENGHQQHPQTFGILTSRKGAAYGRNNFTRKVFASQMAAGSTQFPLSAWHTCREPEKEGHDTNITIDA